MNDYSGLLVPEQARGVKTYADLALWCWTENEPANALHWAQCAAQLAQTLANTIAPHCPVTQEATR